MKKILLCMVLFLFSCMNMEPMSADGVPPVVVEFLPCGDAVPPGTEISVLFSEPVSYGSYEDGLIVLLAADELNGAFLADIDKPPLSASRTDDQVKCASETDLEGRRIELKPIEDLEPGQTYVVVVSAAITDISGNLLVDEINYNENGQIIGANTHVIHEFRVAAGGIRMTEVMANPAGTESQGEYIEIANAGYRDVDLKNWRIDDTDGKEAGDRLGPCEYGSGVVLRAGAVALLVGTSFVAPDDMPVDTLLVCTDHATLTTRGLRNAGEEVLTLSDSVGEQIDRYGGWLDLSGREGCSAIRIDINAEDGPENWIVPDDKPCRSPGWLEGQE